MPSTSSPASLAPSIDKETECRTVPDSLVEQWDFATAIRDNLVPEVIQNVLSYLSDKDLITITHTSMVDHLTTHPLSIHAGESFQLRESNVIEIEELTIPYYWSKFTQNLPVFQSITDEYLLPFYLTKSSRSPEKSRLSSVDEIIWNEHLSPKNKVVIYHLLSTERHGESTSLAKQVRSMSFFGTSLACPTSVLEFDQDGGSTEDYVAYGELWFNLLFETGIHTSYSPGDPTLAIQNLIFNSQNGTVDVSCDDSSSIPIVLEAVSQNSPLNITVAQQAGTDLSILGIEDRKRLGTEIAEVLSKRPTPLVCGKITIWNLLDPVDLVDLDRMYEEFHRSVKTSFVSKVKDRRLPPGMSDWEEAFDERLSFRSDKHAEAAGSVNDSPGAES